MIRSLNVLKDLFGTRQKQALPFSSGIDDEYGTDGTDDDYSFAPPSLADLGDLSLYEYGGDDDQAEGLVSTKKQENIIIRNAKYAEEEDTFHAEKADFEVRGNLFQEEAEHTATDSIVPNTVILPTKILSIVILVFLIITHSLLGRECVVASKSLKATFDIEGDLDSRSITKWEASPRKAVNVRASHLTTSVVAEFSATEAETMQFEVYGKPQKNKADGSKQIHIVSPVNGWATVKTRKGKRYMERVHDDEELIELDDEDNEVDETPHIPSCPIFDAGHYGDGYFGAFGADLFRYQYAPTALVVAQQFWNAAQVFHLFLLISLYGIMTSPFFSLSTTMRKRKSQLVSEENGKAILWFFFILFTILTVILLPFSVYFISPGGHALAGIMTITSLASVLLSLPNVHFNISDLPPRCFTPRQHPGTTMHQRSYDDEWSFSHEGHITSSGRTFTGNGASSVVISGRGLCKIEFIAFLCNLGSSMYNYDTSKQYIFPYWYKIFHGIDKWLGLTGGDTNLNREIPGRFMYNIGIKSYRLPLYMPLSFGSTTGSYVYLFIWSILPFLYVFFFMSMYAMANRAPEVKIQRFFALFGVFHFLFFTDVVSYKYGRGLRNEWSDTFRWIEHFGWRIAILLPIYQNVLSGHYIRHPQRQQWNKYVGLALHYFMAAWGIMFFIYQIVMNDCIHYTQWLMGKEQTQLYGWSYSHKLGYMGTLIVMVVVYGFMTFGGTWCHHLYVGP